MKNLKLKSAKHCKRKLRLHHNAGDTLPYTVHCTQCGMWSDISYTTATALFPVEVQRLKGRIHASR